MRIKIEVSVGEGVRRPINDKYHKELSMFLRMFSSVMENNNKSTRQEGASEVFQRLKTHGWQAEALAQWRHFSGMKKRIFFLTFAVTMTLFSHNGYPQAVVTDGLVSYWTFDRQDIDGDSVLDVWGKNDGTRVGARKVQGRVNGALEFDGIDDYVNLTTLGDFGSQLGTSTFEAWVKTSFKERRWTTLFKVRDVDFIARAAEVIKIEGQRPECGMGWGIDLNGWAKPAIFDIFGLDPGNFVEVGIEGGDDIIFDPDILRFYLTNRWGRFLCTNLTVGAKVPISDGEWHHVVYVNGASYVDENGQKWWERAIFIDGQRQSLSRSRRWDPDDFIRFIEAVYLGAGNNRGKAERFFNGIIDEVRIYNRPLTEDEVRQHFEIGRAVEAAKKLPVIWGNLKTAE